MLGVITLSDRNFLSELTGSNLLTGASYALVISSAIVCLLALFGCFGAAKEIKCMLLTVSFDFMKIDQQYDCVSAVESPNCVVM